MLMGLMGLMVVGLVRVTRSSVRREVVNQPLSVAMTDREVELVVQEALKQLKVGEAVEQEALTFAVERAMLIQLGVAYA